MSAVVIGASRSAASCYDPDTLPAPAGDIFVAANPGAGFAKSVIARLKTDATVVWSKTLAPGVSGDSDESMLYGSNGTNFVAALARKSSGGVWTQYITCFDGSGTELWTVSSSDFRLTYGENGYGGGMVEVDASGNVFVIGQNSANNNRLLIKLNAADGSIAWTASIV